MTIQVQLAGADIYVKGITDFDIEQTLECGQCFHFHKIDDHEYALAAFGKLLHVRQDDGGILFYHTNETEFNNLWRGYFDLDMDYAAVKRRLLQTDEKLFDVIEAMGGVRILNQEFFETLMSFIISQNKQIPHIKQIVTAISEKYGTYLGSIKDTEYYSFPSCGVLYQYAGEEDYRALKAGFRAKYLADAVQKVALGEVNEKRLRESGTDACIRELTRIHGVGSKIANCVALFALGHRSAFPVDVWINRMMVEMYFEGNKVSKQTIESFAARHFGEYGGYAQQYLFYYGRTNHNKLSKSEKK